MTNQREAGLLELKEAAPKLSVCVVTYNQADYIRQCLESILDQETNFDFEVLVGDDCSLDGTREVVQEICLKYPGRVHVEKRAENIGAFKNYKAIHARAKGKYVAHIDGDDYCLPGKFQKQVDFLEANPHCHLVAHRMRVGDGEKYWAETRSNPVLFDLDYLLKKHPCFLNSSMVYRRSIAGDLFASNELFIDFYVYVHFALRGMLGSVDEVLGYYRTGIGISSKRNLMPYIQAAIDLAAEKEGESARIRRCRAKHYLSYAIADLMAGDSNGFRVKLSLATRSDGEWPFLKIFSFSIFCPWLARLAIGKYKNIKRKHVSAS
ncbi:glycosyltransferase [Variovorax paradoxus]|uniref:glycosyltransferase family 2 protein n=1 Tax=Variovorax paradoxus TaxID=34073 RepID=UPI003999EB81